MPISLMGKANSDQGICGFTSALYALYATNPALQGGRTTMRDHLNKSLGGKFLWWTLNSNAHLRLRAEIKTFLRLLQANGREDILLAITTFTQGFGGVYAAWTVQQYIQSIDTAVSGINSGNSDYSIAMPPVALEEYMRLMWGMNPNFVPGVPPANGSIIGLASDGDARVDGERTNPTRLKHYVYKAPDGKIHSWGKTYKNLDELAADSNPQYRPIFYITTQ